MSESIIEKERQENQVNSYHKKTNRNNQQHKLLSRIAVPILFAALVGTIGTSALATVIGGVSSMLFPSAEAAKKIPTCDGLTATIVGKEKKNDVLQGTEGTDVIVGLSGNDQIFGNGGNDHICGGTGDDTIFGGSGLDRIFGDDGNDDLHGDDGDDQFFGGAGIDTVHGDDGDDFLRGDAGDDQLFGNAGDDFINSLDDVVDNDFLEGGSGSEINGDTCVSDPDPEVTCEI